MNLTDELRKLAELHDAGQLTDEEFARAKQRLLSDAVPARPETATPETVKVPHPIDAIEPKRYRSSRWSSGNLFFPDTLTLARDGMLFRKGALFSSDEEHINYRAVASFKINNGIFLSNITIETSGGSQPIFMNGLWKSDSKEIQATVRAYQGG